MTVSNEIFNSKFGQGSRNRKYGLKFQEQSSPADIASVSQSK